MHRYNFKIAGCLAIGYTFLSILIGVGVIWYLLIGAIIKAYVFICFKKLLNNYEFYKSDKFIMVFIVMGIIQPLTLVLLPSQAYLLTVIVLETVIQGLAIIGIGASLLLFNGMLFRWKKILSSILILTGFINIYTSAKPLQEYISTHIPQSIDFISILVMLLPSILYIILGLILLKAGRIGSTSDTSKSKKMIVIITILVFLGISESIRFLPYAVARITSSLYVTINYPTNNLKFEQAEYERHFGCYSARYKDKNGMTLGLMMVPRQFPIIIIYDSKKGQP